MRGEYFALITVTPSLAGSPPLARGVPLQHLPLVRIVRITPACAGSTDNFRCAFCWAKDHPRLRGEYSLSFIFILLFKGSPPLARGVQMVQPAASRETGSPPLARGVQTVGETTVRNDRITPACAGSTSDMWSIATSHRDHPRLRGEYSSRVTASITPPGSPPLARGVQELG